MHHVVRSNRRSAQVKSDFPVRGLAALAQPEFRLSFFRRGKDSVHLAEREPLPIRQGVRTALASQSSTGRWSRRAWLDRPRCGAKRSPEAQSRNVRDREVGRSV